MSLLRLDFPPSHFGNFSANVDLGNSSMYSHFSSAAVRITCLFPAGGALTHLQHIWEHLWILTAHRLTHTFYFQTSEIVLCDRNTMGATCVILSFLSVMFKNVKINRWINTRKDTKHYLSLQKCKSKAQWDTTSHPLGGRKKKRSVGKDVEKLENLSIAGRNVKWYNLCGTYYDGSSK